MHIFILHFDGTVTVEEIGQATAGYVAVVFPKGQLFRQKLIGSMGHVWSVMHRDSKGNGPAWNFTEDKHVPEAVKFARMLMD